MQRSTLSVIMPNYNHAKYIGDALDAILSQSYRPLEVIVVDDASTDNSVEIIQQFVKKNSIVKFERNEKNIGVVKTSLKLLNMAKGDYIYDAAADDKILPDFFEKTMNLLKKYPHAGLCSALSIRIDEKSENRGLLYSPIISKKEMFISPETARSLLSKGGSWISGNTTIYKKDAFFNDGGYIPELHSFCDGFVFMVIALRHGACYIPEPLACYRKMMNGYAANVMRNNSLSEKIYQHVEYLMSDTYKGLFPNDYLDNLRKETCYNVKMSNIIYMPDNTKKFSGKIFKLSFHKIYYSIVCKRNLFKILWNFRFKLFNIYKIYVAQKINTRS